jgi:hypothetical protein
MHARSFLVETLCPNFNSKDSPLICVPSQDPWGSLVSVQSGSMWGETLDIKDTLLPFMTILRAGPDPRALERLQFPPSRIIDSLLTDYSWNYSCFRHSSPTCKDKQCNPLVIENPCSMTQEPPIFRRYGVGQMSQGHRLIRYLCPPSNSQPLLGDTQFYLHSNITSTFVQQLNSGDCSRSQGPKTNCGYWNWVQGYKYLDEWIKYAIRTLNKSDCYACTTRRPESQMVLFSLEWSSDRDGMYCMLALFLDAKAWGNKSCQMLSLLFPEVRGPMGQPLRTIRPPISHQTGGTIDKCGKPDGMQWKPVLQQLHKPVHTLGGQSWSLVVLWRTFTWDSPRYLGRCLCFGAVVNPFHPGI